MAEHRNVHRLHANLEEYRAHCIPRYDEEFGQQVTSACATSLRRISATNRPRRLGS